MARWYQNVLTGEKVEVKTLADDDFYVDNKANWSRIVAPPEAAPVEVVAAIKTPAKTKKKG